MSPLLAGCLIHRDLYERRLAELTDADGDGHAMEDGCNDDDATIFPGALENCDGIGHDCDGEVDEGDGFDVVLLGAERALVFTGLGTFTLRTQADAWMTVTGSEGSQFSDALDLGDRTGVCIRWICRRSRRSGWRIRRGGSTSGRLGRPGRRVSRRRVHDRGQVGPGATAPEPCGLQWDSRGAARAGSPGRGGAWLESGVSTLRAHGAGRWPRARAARSVPFRGA